MMLKIRLQDWDAYGIFLDDMKIISVNGSSLEISEFWILKT